MQPLLIVNLSQLPSGQNTEFFPVAGSSFEDFTLLLYTGKDDIRKQESDEGSNGVIFPMKDECVAASNKKTAAVMKGEALIIPIPKKPYHNSGL